MAAERWDTRDAYMTTAVSKRRRARTASVDSHSLRSAIIAITIALTLLSLAYIREYAMLARLAEQRDTIRKELQQLRQENSNLKAQMEILARPSRIDALAPKLDMQQRVEADFVWLAAIPLPPTPVERRPALAGFLPDSWTRSDSQDR